jgi:tetratricopeptide (TPR) repeat protein
MIVKMLRGGIWSALLLAALTAETRLEAQTAAPAEGEASLTPSPATPTAPPAASPTADADALEKFNALLLAGYEKEAAGDYNAAFTAYSQAVDIREDTPTVFVRRAYCAAKLNRFPEAALDLKRATTVAPRSLTDYSTMSWFYATCPFKQYRDGARAVALAQKLISIRPSIENADLLAAGYAQMGNFQLARDTLSTAIKKYPESPRLPAVKERLALYNQKKKYEENWGVGDLPAKGAEAKPAP